MCRKISPTNSRSVSTATSTVTVFLALLALFLAAPLACAYVDPSTGAAYATGVTRSADIPEKDWLPGHRGVDLSLRVGGDVVAAGDGIVAFAGVVAGTPVLSIDHPDGIRTTYQPVHAHVSKGDSVTEGAVIGRLATSANKDHDGLHWGARTGPETYINPLTLLDKPTIRLKPLSGSHARG